MLFEKFVHTLTKKSPANNLCKAAQEPIPVLVLPPITETTAKALITYTQAHVRFVNDDGHAAAPAHFNRTLGLTRGSFVKFSRSCLNRGANDRVKIFKFKK